MHPPVPRKDRYLDHVKINNPNHAWICPSMFHMYIHSLVPTYVHKNLRCLYFGLRKLILSSKLATMHKNIIKLYIEKNTFKGELSTILCFIFCHVTIMMHEHSTTIFLKSIHKIEIDLNS